MDSDPSLDMFLFKLIKASKEQFAPRLGSLLTKSVTINTPHYVPNTSRGLVPHISQDMMQKHTEVQGVYLALEDFVEKYPASTPAILAQQTQTGVSPLRSFTAMPQNQLTILGARRCPPVECPMANTNTTVAMLTSVGFTLFKSEDYVRTIYKLQPDIVIGLGDIPATEKLGLRRRAKMSGRTERWMREITSDGKGQTNGSEGSPAIFAPILPIPFEEQSLYIDLLAEELLESLSGLALYDTNYDTALPESLQTLPRLSLADIMTPHQVLHNVSNGIDLFVLPFIGTITDAGIAMDFSFPIPDGTSGHRTALGIDMWSSDHAQDVSSLVPACSCYACKKHHRAYLCHLLSAREMLAWVLLQVHNLHVVDAFFAGIRSTIKAGTFEEEKTRFVEYYESQFPEKTGQGPRLRGYQFKAEGPNEPKKNASMYRMLTADKAENTDAPSSTPTLPTAELEKMGFAEAV